MELHEIKITYPHNKWTQIDKIITIILYGLMIITLACCGLYYFYTGRLF